ncbi:MAG TPA: hypothetical protein DDZ68_01130 [Parvularcula sp.]|nr:hypothetical protein [Parvularcula sp.]HBS32754.1 hypothetical protein [Parvularcula sp.]HBS35077.1 hypothetical protein [Parvularcula sp.]
MAKRCFGRVRRKAPEPSLRKAPLRGAGAASPAAGPEIVFDFKGLVLRSQSPGINRPGRAQQSAALAQKFYIALRN